MFDIRRCTINEIETAPNIAAVLAEYAAESAIEEFGPANVQFDTYRNLEASGALHPMGAFEDGRLIGFITVIMIVLPHHGVSSATVESFFVPRAARKKGIGLLLLGHAEDVVRDMGAKVLLQSAPIDGSLARVLSRKGSQYRPCRTMFVKALA
jgi:GNAT superfamily N-acetyltransferase